MFSKNSKIGTGRAGLRENLASRSSSQSWHSSSWRQDALFVMLCVVLSLLVTASITWDCAPLPDQQWPMPTNLAQSAFSRIFLPKCMLCVLPRRHLINFVSNRSYTAWTRPRYNSALRFSRGQNSVRQRAESKCIPCLIMTDICQHS